MPPSRRKISNELHCLAELGHHVEDIIHILCTCTVSSCSRQVLLITGTGTDISFDGIYVYRRVQYGRERERETDLLSIDVGSTAHAQTFFSSSTHQPDFGLTSVSIHDSPCSINAPLPTSLPFPALPCPSLLYPPRPQTLLQQGDNSLPPRLCPSRPPLAGILGETDPFGPPFQPILFSGAARGGRGGRGERGRQGGGGGGGGGGRQGGGGGRGGGGT
ncbi:hypothetical protein N658DRAFT_325797 [Parathielavia hyrcaniae]|uniref:Uncharacterized protein n=1 Tax=Parathielavia hyrcaniae TaxID=113614 RepID=A0AAN6T2X1_9PEZI|nr:hypothetical protein N658DRAFT_325797 [Parathielavia hyrcaniae]